MLFNAQKWEKFYIDYRNPIETTTSQMIEEGKDKLEWYRQVDPTKLSTLKDLINAPNYKDNLGTLIKTIYEFAFLTYSGTPAPTRAHGHGYMHYAHMSIISKVHIP